MADDPPPAPGITDEYSSWPFEPFPVAALDGSVVDRFDAIARRHPARLAASDSDRSLTYSQLAALVDAIAGTVEARVTRSDPIAILLANEARFPAAMLGVLASGRGYVPLDAHHPIERNAEIASRADVAAVISAGAEAATVSAISRDDVPVVDLDRLTDSSVLPPKRRPGPDDLAYITYTSGSTGKPKGVYQNHRGLLHDILQSTNTLRLSVDDRAGVFHSPSLLQGTRIAFGALLNGGSVHMLRPLELGPSGLAAEIRGRRITVFRSVARLFTTVAETLSANDTFDSLRLVYLGGDRVSWSDFDVFRRVCRPDAAFGVHFGATECSTVYLQWFVDGQLRGAGGQLPIGRPLPDRKVALVGADGLPVADGEIGEFAVTSRYVALGYWREPALTARAFAVDADDAAARTFRTGDLGRRRSDGLYEFVGRGDQQIKLDGHRVEPGEVESALRACGPARDAAVVVRRNSDGVPQALIGYVELRPGTQGLLPRHLMAMVAPALPPAMMPAAIVIVDDLPRLANLKLDRRRLAEIDAARTTTPCDDANPLLRQIAEVFERMLSVTGATPDDNLRTLGGNSLQAVEVALELEKRLAIPVPVESFKMSQTIRELAVWASRSSSTADRAAEGAAAADPVQGQRPVDGRRGPLGEWYTSNFPTADLAALVAELTSAFQERRPPGSAVSDVAKWSAALDLLFLAGRLDVLEYGARQLRDAYPGFTYAQSIGDFFGRLPAADDSDLTFTDKRLQAVQVVARARCETVIVLFCDRYHNLGVPLPAIHRWLGRLPASLIYLRDFRRLYFLDGVPGLGRDRQRTLEGLRALIARLGSRRVLCYGNSAGAFAALDYGAELAAEAVLALAGPTTLSPEFNVHLRSAAPAERTRRKLPEAIVDLRPRYAAGARPRAQIVYAGHDWDDRLQAEHMAGLAGVELRPVENFLGHNVTMELIRRGRFDEVLDWLVGETPPRGPRTGGHVS
ncbi:MAG: non-ribosomal peptide synthetase [Bauldia sp.]